ncbi:nucleotide pyrophosphohydrolase [Stenotrophomonas maltophilia]|jgi:dCTP diphosphatase|nr:nucleotide pyrophosphohydrolase [Stenotrophomonas maltophilia]ASE52545.1 nucleotide pyrophosphohydrolase [Stenotrophomonas maltophilia]KWV45524.1 nucleotide pyrophosphohydrolase [Stenotrophomonas maltophilia]MBA0459055.1 nucleotide pyrophosphohydrolase [Stenotrophomonas maltophilia]MBC8771000.1 nucleotide pyrophosphohydrolase [Stenotrophomonas maltophilia]MBH1608420.1 nucleotide pyrophosphohydrolase [Stenotrophomonas maltophilia]
MDIQAIQSQLQAFADERDWNKFHNPKNLAMALAGETGELLELLQWLTPEEASQIPMNVDLQAKVAEELADIALYLLRLSDLAGVDLESAIHRKIEVNALKYPASLVFGSSKKYTEY